MEVDEALSVLEEYGFDFDINESGFNDGSKMISHGRVFDTEEEAKRYILAVYTVAAYVNGDL